MRKNGLMAALAASSLVRMGSMTSAERARGRYMRAPDGHGVPLEMKTWLEGVEQKLADHKVDAGLVREIKARVDDLEQKTVRGRGGAGGTPTEGKSIGPTFAEAEGLDAFCADLDRRPASFAIETKAITTAANSAGALIKPAMREAPVALPQRRLAVRSLVNAIPIESGSVETPYQTSRVSNAGMVAEGTLKPESNYAWEMRTTPVRKIAHWVIQSSEILADAPQLAGVIDTELIYGLDYVEDVQLLKGDGTGQNLLGMKPVASDFAAPFVIPGATLIDQVGLALLQVTLADYDPDGVVLHPSDWMKMRLLKDADGKYLLGDPGANVAPVLFGKPVVPTKGQTVGEFTVGEFKVAATIYDRLTTTVLASTEDGDNFRKNLVTILAEKRLGFATKRPAALVDGAFA